MGKHADKTKGKIKEMAGALTDDKKLARSGRVDQAKATVKGAAADVKEAVKDAVKK